MRTEAIGHTAHQLGVAALLGGNLFGRLAMHPALASVSDQAERGAVVNRAWRRYGTVNSAALVAVVAGSRVDGARSPARDAAVAAVVVTGLATAVEGMRFAGSAPGGAAERVASGAASGARAPTARARLPRRSAPSGRARARTCGG